MKKPTKLNKTSVIGRPPTNQTMFLRNFVSIKQNRGRPPKLEYLRAYIIRLEKKIVRVGINGTKSYCLESKFKYMPDVYESLLVFIKENADRFLDRETWDTVLDPTKGYSSDRSFNTNYCKRFYANAAISSLHRKIIESFKIKNQDHVKHFLKVQPTSTLSKHLLSQLKAFLLSEEFMSVSLQEDGNSPNIEGSNAFRLTSLFDGG